MLVTNTTPAVQSQRNWVVKLFGVSLHAIAHAQNAGNTAIKPLSSIYYLGSVQALDTRFVFAVANLIPRDLDVLKNLCSICSLKVTVLMKNCDITC